MIRAMQITSPLSSEYNTLKLHYNGFGYDRYLVNTDFFLVPAESLPISLDDNTVRTVTNSMDFCFLVSTFNYPYILPL